MEAQRDEEFDGSLEQLLAEIDALVARNRASASRAVERRLLRLRHIAGMRLVDDPPGEIAFVEPDPDALPPMAGTPASPELPPLEMPALSAGAIRAGILRDGCVRVRGLIPREDALALAAQIDRAFIERARHDDGGRPAEGYYEEFRPHSRYGDVSGRDWIRQGGGVLGADAPLVNFELMELLRRAGVPELAAAYLGEPALVSVHKTTLRKAMPVLVRGAWHQDGYFMGPVRSLNLWVALSRCGDEAPGMDMVPKRIERYLLTNTDEAPLDYTISDEQVREAAGDTPIVRPIFEPGDAILFDEWCIHSTASDPMMPNPRFAVENWFFGSSGFPRDYAPLSV